MVKYSREFKEQALLLSDEILKDALVFFVVDRKK